MTADAPAAARPEHGDRQRPSPPRATGSLRRRHREGPALPLLAPDRRDHIEAAELRNRCRRPGVRIGTIGAVLAQLCIRNDLTMLTTDEDFRRAAKRFPLKVWSK